MYPVWNRNSIVPDTPHDKHRYITQTTAAQRKVETEAKKLNWKNIGDKDASVAEDIELSTILMIKLAGALLIRFSQGREKNDLNVAILLNKEVLKRSLPSIPRHLCMIQLANALKIRLDEGGSDQDLDDAVPLFHEVLNLSQLLPPPYRSVLLNNAASVLLTKFKRRGQKADVEEAISLYRQSIKSFQPFDPERVVPINNLAAALVARAEHGGQRTDLDEAISLHKQALGLRLLPHPDRSESLYNLADAMFTRFKFDDKGDPFELDEAISLHRQALELRAPPHPKRSDSLTNLVIALSTRFEQRRGQSDIDEIISLRRQMLKLQSSSHPDRYQSLSNLASELKTRFGQTGKLTDLDEVLRLYREALELLPPLHPDLSGCIGRIAIALHAKFEQGGQETDIAQAISMYREALQLQPPPHPGRPDTLGNLAAALATRFEHGGRLIDLDESISLNRETLEFRPSLHPDRFISLTNLAGGLTTRFEQTGHKTHLDEAIVLHREALELVRPSHPDRALCLNNIANSLMLRFKQGGQKTDLDDTIAMHREALQLRPPPHPDRSISLSNVANGLFTRFEQGRQQIDLDDAIQLNREALQLRPSPHPDRYMSLTNLAAGLSTRFQQIGRRADLNEAISLTRQALDLHSPLHPGRSNIYIALGEFLIQDHHLSDNPKSFEHAMSSFAAATQCLSQSPSSCIRAAKVWVSYADKYKHISAIDAYEVALQTLPQVAALSFDVQSRQEALTAGSDGLARNAARCAIRSGNLGRAIEFLEAGRSVFWSQVLSLRSSFDRLSNNAPDLADTLRHIAISLELGSHRDISSPISDNLKKLSMEREVFRLNRLNEEWQKAIANARKLDGFEDFLRPSRLSSLQSAASEHPIVILVANDDGSNCLIMTPVSIHHIPLTILSTDVLEYLVYLVQVAASQIQISRSSIEETHKNILEHLRDQRGMRFVYDNLGTSDDILRFVLRILWVLIVKPVINCLDIKKLDQMPILQWCPTGAFTFLPIHAAGYYHAYGNEINNESAFDYFISTYIPTIGTLLTHRPAPSAQIFKMMVVVQSRELPSTKQELQNIQQRVPSSSLIKFGVPGADASVETVASYLPEASIVHFACHGKQDHIKPLNSGLMLQDGLLKISRIMKEKIPSGTLAFLCACETGMGDQKLPDEAMSLGASFLFAGFRRVVATMWEMRDQDGPIVADTFYEELFRGPDGKPAPEPDTTKSARALHAAVGKLRSQNVGFVRWVPFIHMGM